MRSASVRDDVAVMLPLDRLLRVVLAVLVRKVLAPDCGVDELEAGREMSKKRSRSSSRRLRSVDGGGGGLDEVDGVPRT